MSTTSARRQQIVESLKDKEYRDLYVAANIREGIAFQIRAMREDRGWTQSELGTRAGMAQESVSQLEDPNYGNLTLRTLRRLASAFDVALAVRFVAFSHLVDWLADLSSEDLAVPGFDDDCLLQAPTSDALLPTGTTGLYTIQRAELIAQPEPEEKVTELYEWSVLYARTEPTRYEWAQTAEG